MNDILKNFFIWLSIAIILMFTFQNINYKNNYKGNIDYTTFINKINDNQIKEVNINEKEISITDIKNNNYITYIPTEDNKLLNKLLNKNIKIVGKKLKKTNLLKIILISWLPIILLVLIWIFFLNKLNNNSKNFFLFGKNKSNFLIYDNINTKFTDVAGCDEAKEEIKDIIQYLKEPKKFIDFGAKIPKGILMIGPPGTGKTLLARAIAGESKVPFLSISGSDFVEIFVGIGASRVRDIFKKAKKYSSCIIFIDEIDSIGKKRSYNLNSNDEREQTLNQILVEMDGFNKNDNIIIIAATNRPDILDPALLRPGRFDKHIFIDLPDIKGRKEILKIHTKNIILNEDVEIITIAKSTPGFSGADLFNLVNEASLIAIKENKKMISMINFEKAKDKIILGLEKKSILISDKKKEIIAYHEAGHTIVGFILNNDDKFYKVSIIPRKNSLGITSFLPKEDVLNINREILENKISILYAGRIAEELIYGKKEITNGSQNDIEEATKIARNMVIKWGYSDILGLLSYNIDSIYNNDILIKNKNFSNETYFNIDNEIIKISKKSYNKAKNILENKINVLHNIKNALLEYETLDNKQIIEIINKK